MTSAFSPKRGGEDEEEDRRDILGHEHRRGRAAHGAAGQVAVGKDARDHGGRGESERRPDHQGDRRIEPHQEGQHGEGDGAQHDLQRRQHQNVAAPSADLTQRKVQADIEQQEHHAQLGQEGRRLVLVHQAESRWSDDQPGNEIADDRAQSRRLGGKGRRKACAKVDDGWLQGFDRGHCRLVSSGFG